MSERQTQSIMWTLSKEELDKQYRLLCKQLHPDRNKDRDTTIEFQDLSSLYKRIIKYRSETLNVELSVSLSELYHGCIKDITVPDPTAESASAEASQIQVLPIFIPMGTMNGTTITLTTAQKGKICVKIKEVNDTKFIRDGYNLIIHLDITLTQALIGDHVNMGHFNGTLHIPTRIPHTNYRHIIPGMGMPIPSDNEGLGSGDLYVIYNVILPKDISSDFAHSLLDLTY